MAMPLRELAWSPDGRQLAFQQRIDAPLPSWLGLPAAPPDAAWAEPPRHTDRLLYRHDAMGELPKSVFHVFVVPADGTAPARQLTQGTWHNGFPHHVPSGPVFSADGSEVLIAGTQRPDWDTAPGDTGAAQAICRQIQQVAFASLPFIPLGQWSGPAAYRATVTGLLRSPFMLFWNARMA